MIDTSPGNVCDVEESVHATKIHKGTEVGDVFDHTFEYLTFFQTGNDGFSLLCEIALDKGFVRNDGVFDGFVDLNHFKLHYFTYIDVVIGNWLDIDL